MAERAALLLIHGDEPFLVDRSVHEWRGATRAAQLDVEVFDAPNRLLDLRRSVAEAPLIDPERAILVRDPPQLTSAARRGADGADALAALLAERAPTTSLCLVAHARVAPQHPVIAAVRSLGGTVTYHPALRSRELRAWLDTELARRRLRLPRQVTERLLEVGGGSTGTLSAELDKVAALAQDGATPGALQAAIAGDEPAELWAVTEQILGPTPARGAATLDRLLADGRSSQHLIAILAGQVRDLLLAQAHLHVTGSAAGLASALHIPEWRAERLARQARAVPPGVLASWLRELHDADRRVKAGEIGDTDSLRILALRAAGTVAATRSRG